jgi:hypothetical protein
MFMRTTGFVQARDLALLWTALEARQFAESRFVEAVESP